MISGTVRLASAHLGRHGGRPVRAHRRAVVATAAATMGGDRAMIWFRKVRECVCRRRRERRVLLVFVYQQNLSTPRACACTTTPPSWLPPPPPTTALYPVFVLDPHFASPSTVGVNRYGFLLEALADLDSALRARGSRLLVLRGKPADVLPTAWKEWGVTRVAWEADTEPYAVVRDREIAAAATAAGLTVSTHTSHTLWDPAAISDATGGTAPLTYQGFLKAAAKVGPPRAPAGPAPDSLPPPTDAPAAPVPTLTECDAYKRHASTTPFKGGESVGLARLAATLSNASWVASFEKPKTDPTALAPSTTVLSPYLKFGCVSAAEVYARLQATLATHTGAKTAPPVSLEGQLLWREHYYTVAASTPNYHRQAGNPICRQIPWDRDARVLAAWENGQTGFPWIDAAMVQLKAEGWIHHLARHAVVRECVEGGGGGVVCGGAKKNRHPKTHPPLFSLPHQACFLTRGHLFQSWEAGASVFDRLLLDADPALNVGNWLWLSASAFFHQYWQVYSPVSFAVKYDKEGAYVRKWVPALARMPAKYVYCPWEAPPAVQAAAGCVIGKDYPAPMVDASTAGKEALARMKAAYDKGGGKRGGGGEGGGGKKKQKGG